MCEFMVVCLNWGAVGDGCRLISGFGMNGHVTLPPFLIFSCLNVESLAYGMNLCIYGCRPLHEIL